MSTQEFENQFEVLYNNITSNQAPGLNVWEKSIFLTKAQDEVLKNHFLPQANPKQAGYDDNQKRQADFSGLMETASPTAIPQTGVTRIDDRSVVYNYPNDVFLIINEVYKVGSKALQVIPLKYDEYVNLMSKPFKRPLKSQAWRLITKGDSANKTVEIIAGPDDKTVGIYTVRYIRRPKPIILGNLDGLTIDGYKYRADNEPNPSPSTITPSWDGGCELDPILHEEILQRAVELAKAAWQGDVNSAVQMGQRSE